MLSQITACWFTVASIRKDSISTTTSLHIVSKTMKPALYIFYNDREVLEYIQFQTEWDKKKLIIEIIIEILTHSEEAADRMSSDNTENTEIWLMGGINSGSGREFKKRRNKPAVRAQSESRLPLVWLFSIFPSCILPTMETYETRNKNNREQTIKHSSQGRNSEIKIKKEDRRWTFRQHLSDSNIHNTQLYHNDVLKYSVGFSHDGSATWRLKFLQKIFSAPKKVKALNILL